MPNLRVWNSTQSTLLAGRALAATTSQERRTGLLHHSGLEADEGLWIAPCEAVHTIGMKFPIDVVFLDKKRKVLKIAKNLNKWRMAVCWRAHSVLELQAGRAEATGTKVGDQLELEKYIAQVIVTVFCLSLMFLPACASRPRLTYVPSLNPTVTRQISNARDLGDGDFEIRDLRQRVVMDPNDLDARLKLAERYRQAGSPELSIEHYRLAADRFPNNATVAILFAKALRDQDHGKQGRDVLMDFCRRNPAHPPELLSLLGTLRDDAAEFAAAEECYREALASNPKLAYLHNNLGYNLLLQGKARQAIPELEAALAIEPHSQPANNNLGLALLAQWTDDRQPKEALLHWQSVSGPATAHNNLATVLIRQHRYAEARQELEIALGYQRNHPAALQNLELLAQLDGNVKAQPARDSFWQRVSKVFGASQKPSGQNATVESASQ